MSREIDAIREAKTCIDPGGFGGEEKDKAIAICAGLFYIGMSIESAIKEVGKMIVRGMNTP